MILSKLINNLGFFRQLNVKVLLEYPHNNHKKLHNFLRSNYYLKEFRFDFSKDLQTHLFF